MPFLQFCELDVGVFEDLNSLKNSRGSLERRFTPIRLSEITNQNGFFSEIA
jgi:hypothetical protein